MRMLMTNHVHLVVDPGEDQESLAKLMKKIAARQTSDVNRIECRSGTLWGGGYRSSIICKETHLLACCRYVEMNLGQVCMVSHPSEYRWTSYRERTGEASGIVDPDPAYLALSANETQRKQAYEKWVLSSIPAGERERIKDASLREHLIGTQRLEEEVAKRQRVRHERKRPGRPKKNWRDIKLPRIFQLVNCVGLIPALSFSCFSIFLVPFLVPLGP